MLTVGVAFVLAARFLDPARTSIACSPVNAFMMTFLFGKLPGSGAWYQVFPIFEALLMIYVLGRTRSTVVWIVVIVLAVAMSIPVLPVTIASW